MLQRSGRPTLLIRAVALICGTLGIAASARSATLDDIRSRGVLVCAVSEGVPGFSVKADDGS